MPLIRRLQRFIPSSLHTVSPLLPTLATAASISSVDLLRRLRQYRAECVVDISTWLRDGFGLDEVIMTKLHG